MHPLKERLQSVISGRSLVLGLTAVLLSLMGGCGFLQKPHKSDERSVAGDEAGAGVTKDPTRNDPSTLTPPDRRGIGPQSTGAELALAAFNPAMTHACEGQFQNATYQALIDKLGGIQFGRTLQFFRNETRPYLVAPHATVVGEAKSSVGMESLSNAMAEADDAGAPGAAESVDIKRADLIGQDGSRVIFLSKTHGLFLVETAGEKPRMTCTTMVPGDPKNFYILNGHVILIINSHRAKQAAAVVVYAISENGLTYKTHHVLENQFIHDSRLFNDTLVTYARVNQVTKSVPPSVPVADIANMTSLMPGLPWGGVRPSEFIVTAFHNLTEQPKVVFEDLLHDQEEATSWSRNLTEADVGRVISKHSHFKDFMSASDRYFVITKEVTETYIERVQTLNRTISVCTNYNPKAQEVRRNHCRPIWEKVVNPEFDVGFSCHGAADFARCVMDNESKFVKAYWEYKGSSCQEHSYWMGRCEAFETKRSVTHYPVYRTRTHSHLMIYKYENGGFIRFDDPSGAEPIAVEGQIKEHKSYQFRDGYLMVVASDRGAGSALRSYKLAEKTLVFAGAVEKMGPGEDLKAVLFTDSEAYIVTFLRKDPLFRIDLNDPSKPKLTGKLDVPGFSSQLIYHDSKLLGIGQMGEGGRSHVKVSLFAVGADVLMSEIDAVALGTDANSSYNNSQTDDQLHHFVPAAGRLYVPYSALHHRQLSDVFSKVCPTGYGYPRHRLSIFHIGSRLEEVAALEFRGNIERVLEYQPGKALAFASGAVSHVAEGGGAFAGEPVRELYQTEGVYKDAALPPDMVVAKQVVRAGARLYKMRFVLGTREQIVRDQPVHVLEISDDLVSCLGEPQIQFFNNELYIGHKLRHFHKGYVNPGRKEEIQISGYLGWKINAEGFHSMSEAELAHYKEKQATYCWIKPGVKVPDAWQELVDHEGRVNELYDCRVGILDRPGRVLN